MPSSVYRVRTAGLLLRRIEEQQRLVQQSSAPFAIAAIISDKEASAPVPEEEDDVLGADGWEPSPADGFQVSLDIFSGLAAHESHAYPATPRQPTLALPSVLGLPYGYPAHCNLQPSTPYDTFAGAQEADVRVRLDRFAFPRTTTAPLTPPSASPLPFVYDGSAGGRPSLKRSRTAEDDGRWSHHSPAAKMNRALAIDIADQRLFYAPAYDVVVY